MSPRTIQPDQLPGTIRSYLAAHAARRTDDALHHFAAGAVVVDQDQTFHGTDEIRDFLCAAGSEFSFTPELIGAQRVDDAHWIATNRLEGDFPGGRADLSYRFALEADLIAELVIAP